MDLKEKWINEMLESIDAVKQAKVSSLLEEKIISGIGSVKGKIIPLPTKTKWMVAASILVLAGLNIVSIIQFNISPVSKTESNSVYTEYFSGINSY